MTNRAARIAILLIAIFAMVGVATHLHARNQSANCDLCLVAHTVTYEAASSAPSAPLPVVCERPLDPVATPFYRSEARSSSHTRGPPSLV